MQAIRRMEAALFTSAALLTSCGGGSVSAEQAAHETAAVAAIADRSSCELTEVVADSDHPIEPADEIMLRSAFRLTIRTMLHADAKAYLAEYDASNRVNWFDLGADVTVAEGPEAGRPIVSDGGSTVANEGVSSFYMTPYDNWPIGTRLAVNLVSEAFVGTIGDDEWSRSRKVATIPCGSILKEPSQSIVGTWIIQESMAADDAGLGQ